jgi:hypothetical protein
MRYVHSGLNRKPQRDCLNWEHRCSCMKVRWTAGSDLMGWLIVDPPPPRANYRGFFACMQQSWRLP